MRYQRVTSVAWRRIGEETVIVHLGRRRMLAVNEAGGAVWDALVRGAVEAGDAAPFLADLEAEGVVERLAGEATAPADAAAVAGAAAVRGAAAVPAAAVSGAAAFDAEVSGHTSSGGASVLWREELHQFGGCGFVPDQSALCDQNPYTS